MTAHVTRGAAAPPALAERRALIAAAQTEPPPVPGVQVTEDRLGGVPVLRCTPDNPTGRVLLWFHGGGYRLGTPRMFQSWTCHLALACEAEVFSVDYRLAPEHPFPDGLFDALLTYAALLPSDRQVLVGGDSAGGGLAAALLLAVADRGLPAPAGAVLCSPWLDLRNTATSFSANSESDALFSQTAADEGAALYLSGHPAADPLASPLLGDWSDQPPVLVQASTSEVLRDDAVALAAAGPQVRLELYDDQPHVWHLAYPGLPGAVEAVAAITRFVNDVAPVREAARA